jgi:hypothetical protein
MFTVLLLISLRLVRNSNYDIEGKKLLARLVKQSRESLVDPYKGVPPMSQQNFYKLCGLGSLNTLKSLEKGDADPQPLTLAKVAPYTINPSTGEAFTELELYSIATGQLVIEIDN